MGDKVTISDLIKLAEHINQRVDDDTRYDGILVDNFFWAVDTKTVTFNINKCYLSDSKIHGKGVFAKKDISEESIITFYPAHYIAIINGGVKVDEANMTKIIMCNKAMEMGLKYSTDINHVYGYKLNNEYKICGDPRIIDDTDYLGHMINDGARGHASRSKPNKLDKEIYNKIVVKINNASSYYVDRFCVAIISIRDIKKGEEILMPYSYEYWEGVNKD